MTTIIDATSPTLPSAIHDALAQGNFLALRCHDMLVLDDGEVAMSVADLAALPLEIRRIEHILAAQGIWRPIHCCVSRMGQLVVPLVARSGSSVDIFAAKVFNHAEFGNYVSLLYARAQLLQASRTNSEPPDRATLEATVDKAALSGISMANIDRCLRQITRPGSTDAIGVEALLPRADRTDTAPLILPSREDIGAATRLDSADETIYTGRVTHVTPALGLIHVDGDRWISAFDKDELSQSMTGSFIKVSAETVSYRLVIHVHQATEPFETIMPNTLFADTDEV